MVTTDLGPERRERIVQRVRDRGTVRISALAAELEVSLMTVRRDIATLAEEGGSNASTAAPACAAAMSPTSPCRA